MIPQWDDLPLSKKLLITAAASTGTGALLGGVTSKTTITGVGFGAVIGFMLWGMSVTVYSGYRAVRAAESAADTIHKLPLLG